MEQTNGKIPFARSPTIETVIMVEKVIDAHSGEFDRTALWKSLPRKVMWQTFLVILDYLEYNHKIITDRDGKIVWIWNPGLLRKLEKQGLIEA
jgi:hypothetical protein